jgi:hypothetical protein
MLGGRAYGSAATQPTIAQAGYLMGVLREHGIDKVIARDGDVLGAVLKAGCASALVAGLVTEDRAPWTRESAAKHAAFFDALPNEENAAFWDALAILLSDFFVPRGSSKTASPTSSTRPRRKTGAERKQALRPATTPENATAITSASSLPSPSTPDGA